MISHIQGQLLHKTPTEVVVETNGVGFQIGIPISSFDQLCEIGEEIKLLTYLHVREDALQLFGFVTENERKLFQLLISISGVGPKLAQGILSGAVPDVLIRAIQDGDIQTLNKIPGVGKKTAQRLVVELKDKIEKLDFQLKDPGISAHLKIADEAVMVLVSLGYKRRDAERVIHRLLRENPDMRIEAVIRQALQTFVK